MRKIFILLILLCGLASATTNPTIWMEPQSTFFGFQINNTSSNTQTVTLWNYGANNASITISSVVISGDTEFAETDNCASQTLVYNGICEITITFTPTSSGAKSGTLTITDANSNTYVQTLTGTGYVVTGTTYYLAVSGVDTNPCNVNFPCRCPNVLNSVLQPGDEVLFESGVFFLPSFCGGPWNLTASGNSTAPITFTSQTPSTPALITDLMQIVGQNQTCPAPLGCLQLTFVNDVSDPTYPNCQPATGSANCIPYIASVNVAASGFKNVETMFYKVAGVGQTLNRRIRVRVNAKNAIPNASDATMCRAQATNGTLDINGNPCNNAQQCANVAFGCPINGLNGLVCTAQEPPCSGGTPWWGGYHIFEYRNGDFTTAGHGLNIGDWEVPDFEIWTMSRMRLSSFVGGTPNVATLTGATVSGGGAGLQSGFIQNHNYYIEGRCTDGAAGQWCIDRCPNGCPGGVAESTWNIIIFAAVQQGENPQNDTMEVAQSDNYESDDTECGDGTLVESNGTTGIVFNTLTIQGGNWCPGPFGLADSQGIPKVREAVQLTNINNWNISAPNQTTAGVQIAHTTGWGLGVHGASKNIYIDSNVITDIGMIGTRIGDIASDSAVCSGGGQTVPSNITFTNNAVDYTGQIEWTGYGSAFFGDVHDIVEQHNELIGGLVGGVYWGAHLGFAPNSTNGGCFYNNYGLWDLIQGRKQANISVGIGNDFGGRYANTAKSTHCPIADQRPPGISPLNPANFCNFVGYQYIKDQASNWFLASAYHGAAGLYYDQSSSYNLSHHNLIVRTTQDSIFNNNVGHGQTDFASQYINQFNVYVNNIGALAGQRAYSNSRFLNRGGQNTNSNLAINNIEYGNSVNSWNEQAFPGHNEPFDFSQLAIQTAGTGYTNGYCNITFTGGGSPTIQAIAYATIAAGGLSTVSLSNTGAGYSSVPTPVFTACGAGVGAALATLTLNGTGGINNQTPINVLGGGLTNIWFYDFNDIWDIAQNALQFYTCNTVSSCTQANGETTYNLTQWQAQGEDVHSVPTNPGFVNPTCPTDDWHFTTDLSAEHIAGWDYTQSGRSNPMTGIVVATSVWKLATVDCSTDYTNSLSSTFTTIGPFGGGGTGITTLK